MKSKGFVGICIMVACFTGCAMPADLMDKNYDTLTIQNDSSQAELEELKANSVSKNEYDAVVAERDELQAKVDEYEQTIADLQAQLGELSDGDNDVSVSDNEVEPDVTSEDQNGEEDADYFNYFEGIRYFSTPISVKVYDGVANIDSFELTKVEPGYEGTIKISYSIKGEANDYGNIVVICYDEDDYQLGTFYINVDIVPDGSYVKFKSDDIDFIPENTVYMNVSNIVE